MGDRNKERGGGERGREREKQEESDRETQTGGGGEQTDRQYTERDRQADRQRDRQKSQTDRQTEVAGERQRNLAEEGETNVANSQSPALARVSPVSQKISTRSRVIPCI